MPTPIQATDPQAAALARGKAKEEKETAKAEVPKEEKGAPADARGWDAKQTAPMIITSFVLHAGKQAWRTVAFPCSLTEKSLW